MEEKILPIDDNLSLEKEQISSMIKRLRAYSNLSQRDLSKKTGITQADISKIERGLANPSINTLSRLTSAMGASLQIDYKIIDPATGVDAVVETSKPIDPKIDAIVKEAVPMLKEALGDDLVEVILFGSCARGENGPESDIDVAILTNKDRTENFKYMDVTTDIATDLDCKYLEILNFILLPFKEFVDKRDWYPFFKNITKDGIIYYGN